MTLTLSALSLNDQPLTQPVVAHFDPPGGTIGRGDQNTLALPDPERHISRQHARIHAEGSAWRITNLSAANAVTVAGRSLAQGESAPVRHRDLVRIGGFLLEVRDESAPDENVRTITRGRAHVPRAAPSGPGGPPVYATTPLPPADALASPSAAEDDPFMALFGPALSASRPTPAAPPASDAGRPGVPAAAAAPDDPFALFDQPMAPAAAPASPPTAASADPFDAWLTPAPAPAPWAAPGGTARGAPSQAPAPQAGGDDLLASLGQDPSVSIDSLFGSPGGTDADLDAFLRQPDAPPTPATSPAAAARLPAVPDHVPD
ncbi:MAG TPA: FHA domain-containing protein, partial [Burkholderiaceae bacterium]|nr:FHA domain-containing protein [Burkholderiaceae bacterium]